MTYCHDVMVTTMMKLRIEFLWLAIGCSHVLATVDKKDKEGSNKVKFCRLKCYTVCSNLGGIGIQENTSSTKPTPSGHQSNHQSSICATNIQLGLYSLPD